jgi:hypothetical protein
MVKQSNTKNRGINIISDNLLQKWKTILRVNARVACLGKIDKSSAPTLTD